MILQPPAHAQSPRSQSTLAFKVAGITAFDVEGAPQITVQRPGSWTESGAGTASYSLVTNTGTLRDITASLDQAPPTGFDFEALVEAPGSEGTSAGWTALRTDDRVVVQGFQASVDVTEPISYRARASAETVPDTYVFTVTYTISAAN